MRPCFVLLLLFTACGEPQRVPVDGGTSDAGARDGAGSDANGQDLGASDGGAPDLGATDTGAMDAGPPPNDCAAPLADGIFDLVPSGPDGQIHATAAFDGDALWLAYNQPEANRKFDVHLVKLACNGDTLLGPLQVSTSTRNDIDPVILLTADRVWLAWSSDKPEGPDTLDIALRGFGTDGVALGPDKNLEMTRAGRPQAVNTWMPALSTGPQGLALAGVWAHDDALRFQVFVQHLTVDGSTVGEAIDAIRQPLITQQKPAIAEAADGSLRLAWVFGGDNDDDAVASLRLAATATTTTSSTITNDGLGDTPAFDAEGRMFAWTAIGPPDPQVQLRHVDGDERFGGRMRFDHSPTIALGDNDGAVAYYRNISGFRNQLVVQYLVSDNSAWRLAGTEIVDTDGDVPPYAPAIARVGPGVFFVAWSVGQSPAFRLKGRFLSALP